MPVCVWCKKQFDLEEAREACERFGRDIYDDYFPEGNVCGKCAVDTIRDDYSAGAALIDLMGTGYDED